MDSPLQTILFEVQNPFSMQDQWRFWRRTHRLLTTRDEGMWSQRRNVIWVDYIYRPGEKVKVYLAMEKSVYQSIYSILYPKGKRRRKSDVKLYQAPSFELEVPASASVCELKLAYENLFALGGNTPVDLPEQISLKGDECARVSFCFVPVRSEDWDITILRKKMENGKREERQFVSRTGWLRLILYYINYFFYRFQFRKNKGSSDDSPWLSPETIQKLNDTYFKTYIRIAAPQHILPKLAKPFQSREGENRLVIQFLPRKEQKASLQELNKQKIGFYSRSDLNPNILSCREISHLIPLLNTKTKSLLEITARPNLG